MRSEENAFLCVFGGEVVVLCISWRKVVHKFPPGLDAMRMVEM